ncbi:hypothetical protein NR995_00020 [Streptomyces albus]|nr:hypothetical protein [Streptomyces albus]UVN53063.1 hypothetical protein NR995_00020 [Streptomyces albus]
MPLEQSGHLGERKRASGVGAAGQLGEQGEGCLPLGATALREVDAAAQTGWIGDLPPVAADGGGQPETGHDAQGPFTSGERVKVGGGLCGIIVGVGGGVVDESAQRLQPPLVPGRSARWFVEGGGGVVQQRLGGQGGGVRLRGEVVQAEQSGGKRGELGGETVPGCGDDQVAVLIGDGAVEVGVHGE